MPRNLICDYCNKQMGDYSYVSYREKDLDFCSEECSLAWGNTDGFAVQFKKCRMLGSRLDRSLKNNEDLDAIINNYRSKSISGAIAGLVYNLWTEPDEITSQGTTEYNDRVYDLNLFNSLKTFARNKSEIINPLNGNNWEDGGLSDKKKTLYMGEVLNTPLSIHTAAVLLAHLRAIKGNQRLDGRADQEGNDDWTGENNQEFIDKITHVDEEHRLALEDFARAAQGSASSANSTSQNLIRSLQQQIGDLQEELRRSQSELLNQKINIKKEKLERLIHQLGISREQIRNLQNAYEQLVHFRRQNYNQARLDEARNNVEIIEQEVLDGGVILVNVQKICRKCEKLAELKWEVSQINQQQFEARQGVPPRYNN